MARERDIHIRITQEVYTQLEKRADLFGVSVSEVVRWAIGELVAREVRQ